MNALPGLFRFRELHLQTSKPSALKRFYGMELGLPVKRDESNALVVQAGGTRLFFEQAQVGSEPFYHFAFNIPENKINRAAEWISSRVSLLRHRDSGEAVTHWESWNADAVYFSDPAGNIVEFIARHTLNNPCRGDFGPEEILYASGCFEKDGWFFFYQSATLPSDG